MGVNDDNMEHLRSYVELGETFDVGHDMGNSTATTATSEVCASGDILSVNGSVSPYTSDTVQVLHDPNGDYRALEGVLDEVKGSSVSDRMDSLSERIDSVGEDIGKLKDAMESASESSDGMVRRIEAETESLDDEMGGLDLQTITYRKK